MAGDRLDSLDAFRGLTIAGMILVNNPGSWGFVYGPLRHAEWHGWTPTDLIFPFFLFIVGVAMAFSLGPRIESAGGVDRPALFQQIARRSLILVGLGLFMSAYPRFDVGAMRIPGVLQRIGLVFFVASLLAVYLPRRGQALVTGGLLLAYWALMTLIPVPGYGPGDLSPEGNLAAYVDRGVFGSHIWRETGDPEGLLSTLPAVATTMSGLFTGYLLRSGRSPVDVTGTLFVSGWAAILVGIVWHVFFPINKNLWTSSYTVFTTGVALQFTGVCYWLIDVKKWRGWAVPGIIFGRNSIAVFFLSGLVAETMIVAKMPGSDGSVSVYGWVYRTLFVPWAGEMNGSLGFAVATVGFWFAMMWVLYRRRVFIKI